MTVSVSIRSSWVPPPCQVVGGDAVGGGASTAADADAAGGLVVVILGLGCLARGREAAKQPGSGGLGFIGGWRAGDKAGRHAPPRRASPESVT